MSKFSDFLEEIRAVREDLLQRDDMSTLEKEESQIGLAMISEATLLCSSPLEKLADCINGQPFDNESDEPPEACISFHNDTQMCIAQNLDKATENLIEYGSVHCSSLFKEFENAPDDENAQAALLKCASINKLDRDLS